MDPSQLSVMPHPVLPSAHLASMKLRSGFKTKDSYQNWTHTRLEYIHTKWTPVPRNWRSSSSSSHLVHEPGNWNRHSVWLPQTTLAISLSPSRARSRASSLDVKAREVNVQVSFSIQISVDCHHCFLCGQLTSISTFPLWITVSMHHHRTLNHTSLFNSLEISSSIFNCMPHQFCVQQDF